MNEKTTTPDHFAEKVKPANITGLLIDVYHETARVVTVPRERHSFEVLLCGNELDIVTRRVGGHRRGRGKKARYFDIVCDDNALGHKSPKISAVDDLGQTMLVGNLFIVSRTPDGLTVSLTPEDQEYLQNYVMLQATRKHPRPYPMLQHCEYA